ncbi:hypothetical protein HPB49_025118 [Dermacentor silvarum]|uniref:Uncharacterized protein n=1 Tax=Dermacentor silvarum TaxID=543639 RepID=A0ACB8DH46_DERSI|nr:hypothetical protein HPB49_025118 [Dermacentor silvarum]
MKAPDVKIEPGLNKLERGQRTKSSWKHSKDRSQPSKPCDRCGSHEHCEATCTFKNAKFFQCGRKGHLAAFCRSKGKRKQKSFVITGHPNSEDDQTLSLQLSSLEEDPVVKDQIVGPVRLKFN